MFKSISKSELKDVQSASLLNTVTESEEESDDTSTLEYKQNSAPTNFNQNAISPQIDKLRYGAENSSKFSPRQTPNGSNIQLVLRAASPLLEDPGSIYMENIKPKLNTKNILNSRRNLEEALIPEFKDSGHSIISGSNLIKSQKYKDVPFALAYVFTTLLFIIISSSIMFSTSESNILKSVFTSTTYYAIKHSIGPLIGAIFISSFVGLLWIFFLCNFIKPFMWFTFLSVPVISFVIFLWMLFNGIFGIDNTLIAANQSKLLSIIPLIITGGHCLFIHRYHALINHCIDIIKVSCIILRQSLDIFGVSLFCLSIQILFSSFWLILFDRLFLLGSSTTIEGKENWTQDANLIYLVPFYLFYYWWTTCIIDGVERSSIAGTVSHWYFHQEETQFINGFNATHISFKRSLTTSFGSICFGGLIASVIRFIQFLRQLNDQIPQSVNFLTTILRWIMWPIVLVSDLVEKISFFTISYVGISGKSFLQSAKSASSLFRRNMARTAIANYSIRVTLYSAIIAYCLITGYSFFSFSVDTIKSPHALTAGIIGTSTSFIVMKFLINIVLYTTDAVYICYNLDADENTCHSVLAHQVFSKN